ncbi:MAG: ribosomal RNA small subunit methyltransferase A [Nitrospirae bacterium]|nr:ribosomal RNA small subunit methyltransferase A [Nitrospirota bacterium]
MAKKHLGQNFLFNPLILQRLIEAAHVAPGDTVVEIGPGHGSLTSLLARIAAKVIAIELDDDLFSRLQEKFHGRENTVIVHGDALAYDYESLESFRVVANIPYYITTPIIFRLMEAGKRLKSMTLTIQKEVAERIAAAPNTKNYGVLSIAVQYAAIPEMRFIIPREAFKPVPKVDSAVIHMTMRDMPKVAVKDEKFFFTVVRTAFSQRRKTLSNALKTLSPDIKEILTGAGIDPRRRAETLTIEEFAALADALR